MTLAIACRDRDGRGVLCCVREARPPFSPEAVVADFAKTLRTYHVDRVTGDRWGGEFVREPFRSHGIEYQVADRPKSDFYRDLLPLVNSGKVELLDNARLIAQLCGLERRVSRAGKDSIDHAPGAHDDLANAAAACLVLAHGAGSSLWEHGALAVITVLPQHVNLVFATLVTNKSNEAGVCVFAMASLQGWLVLLDCDYAPQLTPSLLHETVSKLLGLSEACKARCPPMLFTSSRLAEEFERQGRHAEIIDAIVDDEQLGLSVSLHVSEGKVKLCEQAVSNKQFPLTFMNSGLASDDSDVLRLSFAAGVCCALDTHRAAA
jgi:hypothetical protein